MTKFTLQLVAIPAGSCKKRHPRYNNALHEYGCYQVMQSEYLTEYSTKLDCNHSMLLGGCTNDIRLAQDYLRFLLKQIIDTKIFVPISLPIPNALAFEDSGAIEQYLERIIR